MSDIVKLLVGTMTGTAELVADEIKDTLDAEACDVEILLMDDLDAGVFDDRNSLYIICTSTYGQGDVPDNARDFLADLSQSKPDLAGYRYGVFGLGDSVYADTFNHGCQRFDEVLSSLGAARVGDRVEHNASGDTLAEDAGGDWAKSWIELARAAG